MSNNFAIEHGHVEVMTMYKLVPKKKHLLDKCKPILVGKGTLQVILSGVQFLTTNLATFDFALPFNRCGLELRMFENDRQFVLTSQDSNHALLEEYILKNVHWIKTNEIEFDGKKDYLDNLVNFVNYTGSANDSEDGQW